VKRLEAIADACEAIRNADGLVIGAGAGMGVDSGLPDFRGQSGFWRAYPALADARVDFTEIANPAAFARNARQAWGFYGHRLSLYRKTEAHQGYEILRHIGDRLEHGSVVFTSNVDGHFAKAGFGTDRILECHGSIHHLQCSEPCCDSLQSADSFQVRTDDVRCLALGDLPRCHLCGEVLRPNILLFDDRQWVPTRLREQQLNMSRALSTMHRPVVIECGAGAAIPTVRIFCEAQKEFLVRINPREVNLNVATGVSLACGALEGLAAIEEDLSRSGFWKD
jgi:NAD-dependent SIR2 family protein deacetylase